MKENSVWKKTRAGLVGFIPKHISPKIVVGFLEFLRKIERLRPFAGSIPTNVSESIQQSYIENQSSLSHIPYGKKNVAYSGCEVIAVYNALQYLGDTRFDFDSLLRIFEKDGILLRGGFGTAPTALRDFMTKAGYQAKLTYDWAAIEKEQPQCLLLTFYNNKNNIFDQIHTVCLTRNNLNIPTNHNNNGLASAQTNLNFSATVAWYYSHNWSTFVRNTPPKSLNEWNSYMINHNVLPICFISIFK